MLTLADDGLSDVGLAKSCKRLKIPVPAASETKLVA